MPTTCVALLPHTVGPCVDAVLRVVPKGARCLFLPIGPTEWVGKVFDRAAFETTIGGAEHAHASSSYWSHIGLLARHWPSVTIAFPTWTGELGSAVDARAFDAVVVATDLWHSVPGQRGQREAAWESDDRVLSWLRGTAAEPPRVHADADSGGVPACAWPNLRAFVRLRSLLGLDRCVVVAHCLSGAGSDPTGACWPPAGAEPNGPPRFVTCAGVVAVAAAVDGIDRALTTAGTQAALRCLHAATFNKLSRLSPGTARVPFWALRQLGLDQETAEDSGTSGVFVTSRVPGGSGAVWCCYGAIPPEPGVGAGDFNGLLALAVRRCVTLDPRRTSERPPSGPPDVTVTLLAPLATWQRAEPPFPASPGPFTVGWGSVGRRWDGAVFLPSVWRENPGWTWEHLIERLREKRGHGGGADAAWLVRSAEIGGGGEAPPVVARAGKRKRATTTRTDAAPGRGFRAARTRARHAPFPGPPDRLDGRGRPVIRRRRRRALKAGVLARRARKRAAPRSRGHAKRKARV